MDVQFLYWNEAAKQVNTRFFDSQFLKHPNAKNLFDCLMSSHKNLLLEWLLQLSMDRPNTNGMYRNYFTKIVAKRTIQILLILAHVVYMWSMTLSNPVLRLQIGI